jgi:hypothetical protein
VGTIAMTFFPFILYNANQTLKAFMELEKWGKCGFGFYGENQKRQTNSLSLSLSAKILNLPLSS